MSVKASTVVAVVEIGRPVGEVYRRWTDLDDLPELLPSVERVERLSDDMTHWDARVGGLRRSFYARTVEDVPDECISWESTAGREHNGTVVFAPLSSDRTRVTLRVVWTPKSLLERISAGLGVDRGIAQHDLGRFKNGLEVMDTDDPPALPP
ncbi:SRPBCC family protein [Microbacterium sp. MMO-10]|uniref:SRPBCC family protein n=1 Tax=Microbacterium sp. MMO-10 TaxID=3081272 RepID=UPI00301615A9